MSECSPCIKIAKKKKLIKAIDWWKKNRAGQIIPSESKLLEEYNANQIINWQTFISPNRQNDIVKAIQKKLQQRDKLLIQTVLDCTKFEQRLIPVEGSNPPHSILVNPCLSKFQLDELREAFGLPGLPGDQPCLSADDINDMIIESNNKLFQCATFLNASQVEPTVNKTCISLSDLNALCNYIGNAKTSLSQIGTTSISSFKSTKLAGATSKDVSIDLSAHNAGNVTINFSALGGTGQRTIEISQADFKINDGKVWQSIIKVCGGKSTKVTFPNHSDMLSGDGVSQCISVVPTQYSMTSLFPNSSNPSSIILVGNILANGAGTACVNFITTVRCGGCEGAEYILNN